MKRSCLSAFTQLLLALFVLLDATRAQETASQNINSEQFEYANSARHRRSEQLEPDAGAWKTWVISSGRDYRVPPPPGRRQTQAELREWADLTRHHNAATQQEIAFWDAGAPHYRGIDLITQRLFAGTATTALSALRLHLRGAGDV
jgi:hypothetical protein